jgi:hypothetical protein
LNRAAWSYTFRTSRTHTELPWRVASSNSLNESASGPGSTERLTRVRRNGAHARVGTAALSAEGVRQSVRRDATSSSAWRTASVGLMPMASAMRRR